MRYLFLIFLCGLPFSNFVFRKVDIWHAHGMWFQAGLLILFCWSFFEKSKHITVRNIPLGAFALWTGSVTSFYWYIGLLTHKIYATTVFFPFFNFLCFLLFYKLSIVYLTKKDIERILFGMSVSVSVVLFYCLLQVFNLDQFYIPLELTDNDSLVGTIGNSHHLAVYLAICQPLFFRKGWFNYISLIVLWVVVGL